jgi:hypothetical protein
MVQTKFSAGQRVSITRGAVFSAPGGGCQVIAALPREAGPQQYLVRSEGENFDRIVDEVRLEAPHYE